MAEVTGDDAIFDIAAHAGYDVLFGAQDHVAVGGTHDDHHAARVHHRGGRHRNVRVDVGDGDRGAWPQAGPRGGLFGQPAGLGAQGIDVGRQLLLDDVLHPRVQCQTQHPVG